MKKTVEKGVPVSRLGATKNDDVGVGKMDSITREKG